ncbi:hypothetical protein ACA910_019457 [Epithemia clementina (nom. ined.)]
MPYGILLLDGGVSTHLEQKLRQEEERGGQGFAHRELWSSSLLITPKGREVILDGHKDWINAGCNVISTVTYQCHYRHESWPDTPMLQTDDQMTDLFRHGMSLARRAVVDTALQQQQEQEKQVQEQQRNRRLLLPQERWIVVSSGCFGAALANGAEYTGDYGSDCTISRLIDFHRRKIQVVLQHHQHSAADGIAIETVPSLLECQSLVQFFKQGDDDIVRSLRQQDIACWISLSCRNQSQLNDGTPLEDTLKVLSDISTCTVQAFGLNCCDVAHLPALVDILVRHIFSEATTTERSVGSTTSSGGCDHTRGIVLYPNSGEVWDSPSQTWKKETGCTTPNAMAQHLVSIVHQIDTLWTMLCCNKHKDKNNSNTNHNNSATFSTAHLVQPPRLILGGCCRTTPATIAALRQGLESYFRKNT